MSSNERRASQQRRRRAAVATERRAAGLLRRNLPDTAREQRRRRAAAIAERRAAGQIRIMRRTQNSQTQNNPMELDLTNDTDSETDVVMEHFNRMRNRPTRTSICSGSRGNRDESDESDDVRLGVQDFHSPDVDYPLEPYQLKYPYLMHDKNFICSNCSSVLWKEEKSSEYNCCNKGRSAILPLKPIPQHLRSIFQSAAFKNVQRRYNGLFSFTALGAGGVEKRTWAGAAPPSMLCLHGKAYHRIFDLQEKYEHYNVSNS
ncbi:unnamed protein product, partial [Ectocarpus sp. 4 AP-2014]